MRKAILMMLLAVASGSTAAEWVKVGRSEKYTAYADPATIRKAGDTVTMWTLHDVTTAQQDQKGMSQLSMKLQREFDCKEERSRILYITAHSGQMGKGEVVSTYADPDKWAPIPPESIGEALWRLACGKRYAPKKSPLNEVQAEAKTTKRGLWADNEPVPPWEWRRLAKRSSGQPSPNRLVALVGPDTVTLDNFFKSLKRPDSPNNWLVAPPGFVIKPDTVAPVFQVPVSVLRDTFKGVVLGLKGVEVVEETANGMHVIATTRLMKFKDDIRVLFIPVAQHKSTIALYSASRVGYWDMGTNRRRLEDWTEHLQKALGNSEN